MKFIELSYKDSILHHFHHKEKIKYWFLLIIIIINILLFLSLLAKVKLVSLEKKNHVFYLCLLVQVQAQFILSDDTKDGSEQYTV